MGDEGKVFRLRSGRIAKKKTCGETWDWEADHKDFRQQKESQLEGRAPHKCRCHDCQNFGKQLNLYNIILFFVSKLVFSESNQGCKTN